MRLTGVVRWVKSNGYERLLEVEADSGKTLWLSALEDECVEKEAQSLLYPTGGTVDAELVLNFVLRVDSPGSAAVGPLVQPTLGSPHTLVKGRVASVNDGWSFTCLVSDSNSPILAEVESMHELEVGQYVEFAAELSILG